MKSFREYLGNVPMNEVDKKKIAKEFLDYIGYMDFSDYDWDMGTTDGIEEYLDTIEDEGGDSKYELESEVAKIKEIRGSMKEIGNLLKNGGKISSIESKMKKYEDELAKLKKELDKLV
jgi:vacuolar-type H+-ATPase subunit I/STV1